MAAGGYEDKNKRDLDWENLEGPVPMDLIDPDFSVSGAASSVLPREESEALARETGIAPSGEGAGRPTGSASEAGAGPASARTPEAGSESTRPHTSPDPDPRPQFGTVPGGRAVPADGDSGTTQFGNTRDLEDEFARIRAEMEAEAEAEKLRKQEAEREEQAQRERLEQWMANARARLLKADADLTGPAGRVRIRKESSPSLYRLAEMQRTMHMDGDATVPDGTRLSPAVPEPDPMATISVPADQFLGPDTASLRALGRPGQDGVTNPLPQAGKAPAPAPAEALRSEVRPAVRIPSMPPAAPTAAEAAEKAAPFPFTAAAREPAAESAPVLAGHPVARSAAPDLRMPEDGDSTHMGQVAHAAGTAPTGESAPRSSETTLFRPMTREEALARKVAKLRQTAEEGENTLALAPAPGGDDESRALNLAIAAVVLVGILVVGLGLFAATQAGLFDGFENRIPFLKPKVSAPHAPASPDAAPVGPAADKPAPGSPAAPAPAASSSPAGTGANAAAAKPVSRTPAAQPVRSAPAAPAPAASKPRGTARPGTDAPRSVQDAPKASRSTARPSPAAPAKAAEAGSDDEIPAYARPRSKASNLADNILRNAVQTAANIDKFALREIYNRFALGYPGLSGEVKIGLTVDPGGRILEGSIVNSTTGVDAFDQELLRKVLEWRLSAFPETRPKFITVPFLFPMQGH